MYQPAARYEKLNMRLKSLASLSLFALFALTAAGQAGKRDATLLAVECESRNGLCETHRLVGYGFKNGELVSQTTILSTPTGRVRYDLGENHIYLNRYVITNWGDVID